MATKKQKREQAAIKRAQFEQAERERHAVNLAKEQAKRDRERRQAEAEARRRKDSEASKKLNAIFGQPAGYE